MIILNSSQSRSENKVEINEHRAPTDDSIRLYHELEDKARATVRKGYVYGDDNTFKGSVTCEYSARRMEYMVLCKFTLNGEKFEVLEGLGDTELETREQGLRILAEAISKAVTEKLMMALGRVVKGA